MKTLVTGGFGYIGSILCEVLLTEGHVVTAYDNLMYRQSGPLHLMHNPNFQLVHGDVRDHKKLETYVKEADAIIPLAALVGSPACDANSEMAVDVNYKHVKFITDIAHETQFVCCPCTNSGYGVGEKGIHCTEETPMRPISLYGTTKCDAEKEVMEKGGISLRLATVFGCSSRQRLDLLVNDFTYRALTDGVLVLFEKHFKRNYIHIRDVASAFLFMMEKGKRGEAYNVGLSSANLSKWELANKIKEYVPTVKIICDEFSKDKDQRNYLVSNYKLESLGWMPQYSLDDGIKEIIKAYPVLFKQQQVYSNL